MTTLTKSQLYQFELAANALIKFLATNCHPYTIAIVDNESAQLMEGVCSSRIKEKP